MYIDNVLKASETQADTVTQSTITPANLVLGRFFADNEEGGTKYGVFTIDYLTIWDRPLSATERNLLHQ